MNYFKGNILHNMDNFDSICILTNGTIKRDGSCVMGAGIAGSFKNMFPGIDFHLGSKLKRGGNKMYPLGRYTTKEGNRVIFLSFPTKNDWRDSSDIELIKTSCVQLMGAIEYYNLKRVALPRPGCGCGGLDWKDIEPILRELLDDRVIICSF